MDSKQTPTKDEMAAQGAKSEVAAREEEMLAFWNEHDVFNKSLLKDAPNGDFVFYDGPPFATGLPHYGHILAGTIKDAIPRFWTMNGYRVKRKWGWDCHGLPLENIIEKRLGLATKRDIEEMGVKNFNEAARSAVMEYADDWRRIIPRMGRFVDMDDDYKTMDATYTESVWWVFSELNRKGLVYEGFKSMHLCPRCGTTLSNFEVNQGYKDIKDIAVTVALPLIDAEGNVTDTSLLVWTTTPWTLPGNMAAAVHNEIEYVKVRVTLEEKTMNVILAKARLAQLGVDTYEVLETFKGSDLVGKSYQPPFAYFKNQNIQNKENAWKIYHADYVELGEEGTGAVHLAPAYGEEDMELAKKVGIPIVHHVDHDGRFMPLVTDFAGKLVKPKDNDDAGITHLEADIEIVKALKQLGALLRKENITHSYPHCWRCDTPLLNYATTSWFVRVTEIKDQLVSENSKVTWIPEHVGRARFGKWLEGARDWAISRQRYWGAPLPIWRNEITKEYKVLGSLSELKQYVPKSGNTYTLMRHGESELNTKWILNGVEGVKNPLTENGKAQVDAALATIGKDTIDLIYYSPLERTQETAFRIAEQLGLPADACISDGRLREMQFGVFEGKEVNDYHAFFGSGYNRLITHPHGGETWTDVKKRAGEFLYEINQKHTGKRILIVAHNGVLQMLQAVSYGTDHETLGRVIECDEYDMKNAELRALTFTPIPHNDTYELDFHRPYIDDTELVDADGTKLTRVPDVFDCWFESGSMPYAQNHYPFEHLDEFNLETSVRYPADFIAESIDQTRGWFYSLMVIGVALSGKSPYKHVITNGLVLAEDGKKMSKSLQNYPDPMDLANRVGVDAMRYYLLSSPIIKGEDLNFSEKEVLELQRKNLGRLHNVYLMYAMYADESISAHANSTHILDRWILARLQETVLQVTEGYKGYELDKATRPLEGLIDDLSVWYLRRSRERLKDDDVTDKQQTIATLRYVLKNLALLMAPVMPFYAEYLFLRVREAHDAESAHLMDWPQEGTVDTELVAIMSVIRSYATMGLKKRSEQNIKVRQPLQSFWIKHSGNAPKYWDECAPLLMDELNVKEVILKSGQDQDDSAADFDWNVTPALKQEGDVRELMRTIQDVRKSQGLNPHDRITLGIDGMTKILIAGFEELITATVGAAQIVVIEGGKEEVTIGEQQFRFSVTKD